MTSLLLALTLATGGPATTSWVVDPAASTVRYRVVHKLHQVDGASSRIEGKASVQANGHVITMLRAPIDSFDSGDRNRDSHLLEVMESATHPFVVVKAAGALPPGTATVGAPASTALLQLDGAVELHGVKQPISVPVELEVRGDGSARARGGFDVSLEAHRVERPSLLFVKVEDRCRIEFDLALQVASP